jgi:hypothetical protein
MEEKDDKETLRNIDKKLKAVAHSEEIDAKFGFLRHKTPVERIGWLINFQPVFSSTLFKTSSC